MDEQVLDVSAIDALDDYELTGDVDELPTPEPENQDNSDSNSNLNNQEPELNQEENLEPSQNLEPDSDNKTDDFTKEILRLKGIKDPSKIKFEDASGAVVERNWDDLSTNEKLSILTLEEDTDTDLEDEEISFINMLRENQLTPSLYLQLFQNNIMLQIQDNQPVSYEIDNLSDDELFALDLIERLGEDNVTDDELKTALEQAKSNEELYQKQVQALRSHYIALENLKKYEVEQASLAQYEENYRNFSEQVLNLIEGFEEIAGQELELSVDDKNDIANYILTRDETGQSDFYKDLQNPQTLTAAAFWMLKGPEIMQELQVQILEAYKRGYALGNSSAKPVLQPAKPLVVITPKPTTKTPVVNKDASAAFGDDESYLYN